MSHNKQFTLYGHEQGINLWKVSYVLEELGLSHEDVFIDLLNKDHKTESYMELNPNGKIPTLVDHGNDDFAIFESNAMLKYLINEYDPEHKISVADSKEAYELEQWLFFQASGQGPYFGQAQWFMKWHHECLPSAIKRYQDEILRVFSVLERIFNRRDWLIGNKPTIADLSFVRYNEYAVTELLGDDFDFAARFPKTAAWHKKLMERPAVAKVNKHLAEIQLPRPEQPDVYRRLNVELVY